MDDAYLHEYEAFEKRHWWFVARRKIILQAIAKHARPDSRWLDVGCGSGVLLAANDTIADKVGVDLDPHNVERGRAKGLDVRTVQRGWDFSELGTFDLITLCDVVEHVEHEEPAIEAVYRALRPGGIVLVTVPALMSLWGPHDVVNHHYRRYTKRTLRRLFDGHRWQTLSSTYFSSLLLPMIWLARKAKNLRGRDTGHDLKFGNPKVDRALLSIFSLESPWLRIGTFPLGSSLMLVCRKRGRVE
ncbi:MAG TPA: class I SAM-dependent methyltransferase [Tepidisphaeraceae bacterium]|jgi:SAM-dependent methyltransferase|nr:class I SAM-dependent methyltransferase [Tepidisphaeraceae bacterium]